MCDVVSRCMLIFFSTKRTVRQRIVDCGYVLAFLRHWRLWVWIKGSKAKDRVIDITLMHSFLTRQTFQHTCMSVMMVLNTMRMFRDCCPELKMSLADLGSDCCESLFSSLGGHGLVSTASRDFNYHDARAAIDDMTLLHLWKLEARGDNPDDFRKLRKGEFLGECQENQELPDAPMSGGEAHLNDDDMVTALDEGIEEARRKMVLLDMARDIQKFDSGKAWRNPELYDDFTNIGISKEMREANAHDSVTSPKDPETDAGDGNECPGDAPAATPPTQENVPSEDEEDAMLAFDENGLDLAEECSWQNHTHKGRRLGKHSWKMLLPGDRLMSKWTCLRMMVEAHANDSMDGLARLPKDRRLKIVSIAKQEGDDDRVRKRRRNGRTGNMEDVEVGREWIEPFTNVAMAFDRKGYKGQTVWHGQVQRIFRHNGKTEEKDGMSTANTDVYDAALTCLWCSQHKDGTFSLNNDDYCNDVEQHSMKTYLGNVDLGYDPNTDKYHMRDLTQV